MGSFLHPVVGGLLVITLVYLVGLLRNTVVIYKHMEHWTISSHSLHTDEAPVAEYVELDFF